MTVTRRKGVNIQADATDSAGEKQRYPAAPPTFSLGDIRKAIPAHCFEKSALRSFAHLVSGRLPDPDGASGCDTTYLCA